MKPISATPAWVSPVARAVRVGVGALMALPVAPALVAVAGAAIPGDTNLAKADSEATKQEKGRPRNDVEQNRQARDAIRDYERQTGKRLAREQVRQAHDEFRRHPNPGYDDLVDILKDAFGE